VESSAIDSKELAIAVAQLADQKKGLEIEILDVGERLRVADYFVLVTGTSRPHVKALFNELHVRLKASGENHKPVEGDDLGWWILLDYGGVIVHLMQPEAREYYALELLYTDCPRLDWDPSAPPSQAEERAAGV